LITGRINGTFVIELVSVDLRSGLIEVGTGRKEESSLFLDRSLELIDLL
jgi:phage protein U